jgi:hypothetical protein
LFLRLFEQAKIDDERWDVLQRVRTLAQQATRSFGTRAAVQSHLNGLGVPKGTALDTFCHSSAERRWRALQTHLGLYRAHGLVDEAALAMALAIDPIDGGSPSIGEATLQDTLDILEVICAYVYR